MTCRVPTKAAEYSGAPCISYYKLDDELCFGYEPDRRGFKLAAPEKAVIDTLYFYLRGKKFYFNIFADEFGGSAIIRGSMALRLLNSPRYTNDTFPKQRSLYVG